MPRPLTVWAVELGPETALDEIKGTLALQGDALVFTPWTEGSTPVLIGLSTVTKVRRLRGSPVLMVVHADGPATRRTAFYFAQPPPLGALLGQTTDRPSGMAAFRNPKRRARRENAGYLGITNRDKKALLTEWVRAVRAAAGTA